MNAIPQPKPKHVVTYTRVSSEDQKEQETIRTQQLELRRQLMAKPEVDFLGEYSGDGVFGCVWLQDRPGGMRLLQVAARGIFEEAARRVSASLVVPSRERRGRALGSQVSRTS